MNAKERRESLRFKGMREAGANHQPTMAPYVNVVRFVYVVFARSLILSLSLEN